jgi:hypothetical protein
VPFCRRPASSTTTFITRRCPKPSLDFWQMNYRVLTHQRYVENRLRQRLLRLRHAANRACMSLRVTSALVLRGRCNAP